MEWTSLSIKQDGTEPVAQNSMPLDLPDDLSAEHFSALELPDTLSEEIKGEVTVAIRSSELLMRTMKFPTSDPAEIADMVEFQVDKISPFPIDQLAIAHEILETAEDSAQVLMAAAKRESIDAIGDAFEKQKVRIHRIDARVLGWLQLMKESDNLHTSGCEILIIVDGIDFVLAILHNGLPIAFRSLRAQLDDMTVVDELTYEIGYTLTTLDTEYDLPAPGAIYFWSHGEKPNALLSKLSQKTEIQVHHHDLNTLPPLSEGMLQRTMQEGSRIELIPQEWVEHEKRRKLNIQFSIIAGSIAAVWLSVLLVFLSVFKVRDMKLESIQAEADAIAPAARQAAENQKKLKALKVYTDRSSSPLECLREVTRVLPAGDIEFISYNYTKEKGVSIRGTGRDQGIVTDFYASLDKSPLFDGIKNESVNDQTTKGVKRAVFSVTLPLAGQEEQK
jgi:hypothetical protein